MKINRFNQYINESKELDYLDYFQSIIDEYGDMVEYEYNKGEITFYNHFQLDGKNRDIKLAHENIIKVTKYIEDFEHVITNMEIDKVKYSFFIDEDYTITIRIVNAMLANLILDYNTLIDVINDITKKDLKYKDFEFRAKFDNTGYISSQNNCNFNAVTNSLIIFKNGVQSTEVPNIVDHLNKSFFSKHFKFSTFTNVNTYSIALMVEKK